LKILREYILTESVQAILKKTEQKNQKVVRMPLKSDCQPPEILRPGEKAFDFPAAFMPPQLPSVLSFDFGCVAAGRSSQLNAFFQKFSINLVVQALSPTSFSGIPRMRRLSRTASASFTSCGEVLARQRRQEGRQSPLLP
jgi:hypothetical protein